MAHMQAQLQRASALFYDRLPPLVRQQLLRTFGSMDVNGDGRISLPELIHWARTTAASNPTSTNFFEAAIPVIFAFVDTDRNGTLDFNECKGLFFIGCTPSRTCDGCGMLLLESAYTCADCTVMHSVANVGATFDLCAGCYSNFRNPLPFLPRKPWLMHPHRNMVEQRSELADAIDDLIDQVQCAVCKEYHRGNAQGIFIQRHVQVGSGPRDITACEWCIACLCSACGKHFQGPRETAAPGRWAMQAAGACNPCRRRGIMPGASPLSSVPFSPEKMMKSPAFEECSTCKAKLKDGSFTTPRGGMFGAGAGAGAGAGGYNVKPNIFGSHSFGHTPHIPMPSYNAMGSSSFNYGSPSYPTPNFNPMGSLGGGSGNSFDSLMQMYYNNNNNAGMSTGSPFDMLNVVNNMGSMGNVGSPLDMINMVSSMGNPLDMLSMVSMCSIM